MFRKSGPQIFKRFNSDGARFIWKANPEKAKEFAEFSQHQVEHARASANLWRNISIGTIPVLAVCAYYVYGTETHHLQHLKEVAKVPDEDWPVEFEYQNIRSRKFFWGDGEKTMFWSWANHRKTD